MTATLTLPGVSRCPARPATGHPQRVLRGWLYELLGSHTYCLTIPQICKECPGFTEAEIRETAALLCAAKLLRPVYSLDSWTPLDLWTVSVDQACLNTVCGAVDSRPLPLDAILADYPLSSAVNEAVVVDVIAELVITGRVERTPYGARDYEVTDEEHKARERMAAVARGMAPKAKKARAK